MSPKLTDLLKGSIDRTSVASSVNSHERSYDFGSRHGQDPRAANYREFIENNYNLVTDLYEYGWGESFHFAPRVPGESFHASLARHQHFIALALGLRPGMRVADLGCGVGAPLREIARFSGSQIVGVNISAYQLERAPKLTDEAGLSHLAEYLETDFTRTGEPEGSFDAVYAIEATCHAPDRADVFGEAFRLLKTGGCFASYEWCVTDQFDSLNSHQVQVKNDIELGTAIQDLITTHDADVAMGKAGFGLLETRDLADQAGPAIPWYEPLVGSGVSLTSLRSSRVGRAVTHQSLRVLEALRVVPPGTPGMSRVLNIGAAALAEAGRLGIFTPMYFVLGRKPV
ncbi:sterol methyltransferase [Candidatus Poriferisodalis sp.]|uniref:sterol methyltransferase n=1 Tax=Candidatus Poriferisodalis sp. TaxID=3101277 RepID=UPI003C6F7733